MIVESFSSTVLIAFQHSLTEITQTFGPMRLLNRHLNSVIEISTLILFEVMRQHRAWWWLWSPQQQWWWW